MEGKGGGGDFGEVASGRKRRLVGVACTTAPRCSPHAQASIVAALSSDYAKVTAILDQAAAQLGVGLGTGTTSLTLQVST